MSGIVRDIMAEVICLGHMTIDLYPVVPVDIAAQLL